MITPESADLTNLFKPPASPEPFRQGEILTFNAATGANTVRLGNAVLTDLPILVGGDTVNFTGRVGATPGDAVILLKYRSAWAILGRIVGAGNEALTASAVDFFAGGDGEPNFTITNAYTEHGHIEATVPAWANSALVFGTSTVIASNTSGSTDSVRIQTRINGVVGPEAIEQVPDGNFHTVATPNASALTVVGGSIVTIECFVRCNGGTPWPAGGIQSNVNAIAIFRRA